MRVSWFHSHYMWQAYKLSLKFCFLRLHIRTKISHITGQHWFATLQPLRSDSSWRYRLWSCRTSQQPHRQDVIRTPICDSITSLVSSRKSPTLPRPWAHRSRYRNCYRQDRFWREAETKIWWMAVQGQDLRRDCLRFRWTDVSDGEQVKIVRIIDSPCRVTGMLWWTAALVSHLWYALMLAHAFGKCKNWYQVGITQCCWGFFEIDCFRGLPYSFVVCWIDFLYSHGEWGI